MPFTTQYASATSRKVQGGGKRRGEVVAHDVTRSPPDMRQLFTHHKIESEACARAQPPATQSGYLIVSKIFSPQRHPRIRAQLVLRDLPPLKTLDSDSHVFFAFIVGIPGSCHEMETVNQFVSHRNMGRQPRSILRKHLEIAVEQKASTASGRPASRFFVGYYPLER